MLLCSIENLNKIGILFVMSIKLYLFRRHTNRRFVCVVTNLLASEILYYQNLARKKNFDIFVSYWTIINANQYSKSQINRSRWQFPHRMHKSPDVDLALCVLWIFVFFIQPVPGWFHGLPNFNQYIWKSQSSGTNRSNNLEMPLTEFKRYGTKTWCFFVNNLIGKDSLHWSGKQNIP